MGLVKTWLGDRAVIPQFAGNMDMLGGSMAAQMIPTVFFIEKNY